MNAQPLATGALYGRAWTVHRAVGEALGELAAAYLEWSYDDQPEIVRQARPFAEREDEKVWSIAAHMPSVHAAIARAKDEWRTGGGPQAAQLRGVAEATGRRCYLRFGDLPSLGYSINHRDGRAEAGVSVYPAWQLPNSRYVIDLRGLDMISSLFIIDSSGPAYEVVGDVLDETGADGEPLIANAHGCAVDPALINTVS